MSLGRFISLWMAPEYPPAPVTDADLAKVEQRFGFDLPSDYRNDVLRYGLARPTIALLDTIVDRELPMADLAHMLSPDKMIEITLTWRDMGLPGDMVAFAADCCGNLFCFRTKPDGREMGGAPVFLFDHDFGTTRAISPSFADWIEAFCLIAPD
jgi:cell wall assembly regulator SMI1